MSNFNLLEEKWIAVMSDEKGRVEEVSLLDIFKNADNYVRLAGDMPTQDFAVLRFLLAILHTVFARFDADGNPYHYMVLDDKYRQTEPIDEDDEDEYIDDLMHTWETLWGKETFPSIVEDYLLEWHDRFYLFDDKFPFYQINKAELTEREMNYKEPSHVYGKDINRRISESGNKIALFSPKYGSNDNKDKMPEAELVRWLIYYQGYTGLSSKATFNFKKGKSEIRTSKGWLYDMGGITLSGNNLYETLLLNLAICHPEEDYLLTMQKPSWEFTGDEVVERLLRRKPIDNVAELYTNWARAIYIDHETDTQHKFFIGTVKLPEINHKNNFLELMTLWRFNKEGDNKDTDTPRKHKMDESFWRSFGSVFLPDMQTTSKRPGIIDWYHQIESLIDKDDIVIQTFGLESDGNATSWVPADEYADYLKISDHVLFDVVKDGWVPRITAEVEIIKCVIDRTLKDFVKEIKTIRNVSSDDFVTKAIREAYSEVDIPFREWLSSLEGIQSKEERIAEWRQQLCRIVIEQADKLVETAGTRDYRGVYDQSGNYKNIATAYNSFRYWLKHNLDVKKRSE